MLFWRGYYHFAKNVYLLFLFVVLSIPTFQWNKAFQYSATFITSFAVGLIPRIKNVTIFDTTPNGAKARWELHDVDETYDKVMYYDVYLDGKLYDRFDGKNCLFSTSQVPICIPRLPFFLKTSKQKWTTSFIDWFWYA